MKIYHGGYCPVETPEIIEGKYAKDFGTGFYCTELREQAVRWAKRYETPMISIYNFELNPQLNVLHFTEMTEEWLDFIVNCRNGVKHHYDMAKFKHPTHQVNFCTSEALKCITFNGSEEV